MLLSNSEYYYKFHVFYNGSQSLNLKIGSSLQIHPVHVQSGNREKALRGQLVSGKADRNPG